MTTVTALPGSGPALGRVLVTGGHGFVGRHLVERLRAGGVETVAPSRAELDLRDPVRVREVVGRISPDVLLHLAATRGDGRADERADTTTVNAISGSWLVEALPPSCRVAVRLGSSTEYAASGLPMDERTPLAPRGFFGATKAAGSILFAATAAERGIRSVVLRAFQVYGPADKPTRFVPTVLDAAETGRPLRLTAAGLRRDWVWVGDVVDGCIAAVERDDLPPQSVFNLGTGVQTANEDLVAVAERVTGRRIAVALGALPSRSWDAPNWVCDPSAARRELGWQPQVGLADGLARCWAARHTLVGG